MKDDSKVKYPHNCLTCSEEYVKCQYAHATFSSSGKYYILECLGPDVPYYSLYSSDDNKRKSVSKKLSSVFSVFLFYYFIQKKSSFWLILINYKIGMKVYSSLRLGPIACNRLATVKGFPKYQIVLLNKVKIKSATHVGRG